MLLLYKENNCHLLIFLLDKIFNNCCIVVIHIQLFTYIYTCGNIVNTIMTNEHTSLDWTNCNILTPSSFDFSSTSFLFCWAAQSGVLRAHSPLLGPGSHYSILSPTNSNSLNFPSHRVISLFDAHLLPVSVTSALNSTRRQSRLYPGIFDRIHLFLDWWLSWRSICYTVIM